MCKLDSEEIVFGIDEHKTSATLSLDRTVCALRDVDNNLILLFEKPSQKLEEVCVTKLNADVLKTTLAISSDAAYAAYLVLASQLAAGGLVSIEKMSYDFNAMLTRVQRLNSDTEGSSL